jgi:2-dehydro-3-deoxyphosphogluconate aldolase/(4S)-4-hydroxy-2-oxoglutarate aldolase
MAARAETLSALLASTAVGVVRADDRDRAHQLARLLLEGGLGALEITAGTPGAFEIIAALAEATDVPLGIGTVRSTREVDATADAGGRFVVSPHTDEAIITRTLERGLVSIPGAMTPTEILRARAAGADFVKIFPIDAVGGATFVYRVRGPLPDVPLWVSGDVSIEQIDAYVEAGVSLIGLTSALTADLPEPLEESVPARAAAAMSAVQNARGGRTLLTIQLGSRGASIGLEELRRLPESEHTPLEAVVTGRRGHAVRIRVLLEHARVPDRGAAEVVSADGFSREMSLEALYAGGFIHYATDGRALSAEEGGPLRLYVVGADSHCDNVKGLAQIRVLE